MAHRHSFSQDAGRPGLLIGEQSMSRRTMLRKLAGLTLAGGSIISFVTSCSSSTDPSPVSQTSTGSPTNLPPTPQTFTSSSLRTALYTYRGHSASVMGVVWSPDGKRIASGSDDGTVQVWDAANGGHVYTYRGYAGRVNAVAWSPDGKRIASGSNDGTAQVWDAVNGGHVYTYRGH
jgi:WD40 repeat protein